MLKQNWQWQYNSSCHNDDVTTKTNVIVVYSQLQNVLQSASSQGEALADLTENRNK